MATITKEIVMAVKKYTSKYPEMGQEDLAKLCGISASSVGNIRNGLYNHLIEENGGAEEKKSIPSSVPYDAYKRLCICELIVGEIFDAMILSEHDSEERIPFVSSKRVCSIMSRYLPEEYKAKVNEITCLNCKKPIQGIIGKDGVSYNPREIYNMTKGLCTDCFKQLKAQNGGKQ